MAMLAEISTLDALVAAVGGDALLSDPASLELYGQDVFSIGHRPIAILRPRDIETLAAGVKAAAKAGLAIVPRGGGMSYTSGYLPDAPGALVVDMAAMDRILTIDPADMTVTVEAGCSWAKLYETLHPLGLRTPLWGTLSGIRASVGGGMSQNGLFWGARGGSIAATALCFDVVLANGSIVRTGSDVLRPFGPDITGLFAADCGALGIKAHVTLPLIREASHFAYGSFAFDTPEQFTAAMSEIARAGFASESFGFDPFLQAQRMKRDSLGADAKALVGMMKAQGGFWKGLKEGAKVVAAGRSFLDDATFSIHTIAEGRNQPSADADMAAIRAIVTQAGGREVENTIPKVLRANPFPPVNSMLGPSGERWVPVHGIVRHSKALATIEAVIALFEAHAVAMERLGVGAGYMFLPVATTGFLIEPVFYWPDAQAALHKDSVEAAHLAKLRDFPANAEGRALVEKLRAEIIAIFGRMDGIHFQIGRTYPVKERSDPGAWAILEAVKAVVDPDGRMNPGVLGL
ncbi:MAG: FAD-binding oxidoreductase [Sphingomonas sp. 28-62-20]|uniref:FAD-binding oxidoreductase n=1 Tax=Sphingomonas sp. 28-62-20 TaxID=1970433 RepID=UPI000BD7CA25|nr:MAG: FAD-binding oxidoreductase [Sphingomonas sp. 28-62-20]